MPIDFYYSPFSPPCRSVLMMAEELNIKLNIKEIDIIVAQEHLKPEFVKINPQHCVPTIVDDGFALWESRAILTYLATKYGDGSLYPTDLQKRALVDQRLYFDMTLYERFADCMYPPVFENQPADEAKLKKVHETLEILNTFLKGNKWVAGSTVTVADISTLATLYVFQAMDVDILKYPNIKAWLQRAKSSISCFKLYEESIETFRKLIQDFKAKMASA